jgi:RHS repeat-associated protein
MTVPLSAQYHPNQDRGFSPDKVYDYSDLDHLNDFNGNLVVTVPLGAAYRVHDVLSYAFTCVYNSDVWDFIKGPDGLLTSIPNARSNAGMGWQVTLGRLISPADPTNQTGGHGGSWIFETPDGGAHVLSSTDGNLTGLTKDGSFVRMRTNSLYQRTVDLPDGTRETYSDLSLAGTDWRLTAIDDAFGNHLGVSYPSVLGYAETWQISDGEGRTQTLYFVNASGTTYPQKLLDNMELTAFGGAVARVQLSYVNRSVARDPHDNTGPNAQPGPNITAAFLTSITLPDAATGIASGEAYRFLTPAGAPDYDLAGTTTGRLRGVQLPTLGWMEWDYALIGFPTRSAELKARTENVAVSARRTLAADRSLIGDWSYTYKLTPPVLCTVGCPGGSGLCSSGDSRQAMTLVTGPERDPASHTRDTSVHYFSVFSSAGDGCPDDGGGAWSDDEYSAPFTHYAADGDGRYLSVDRRSGVALGSLPAKLPAGALATGTLLRSEYVNYDHDAVQADDPAPWDSNRRVRSSRTSFDDDLGCGTACYKTTDFYSWDGFGHFRQASQGGNFTGGVYRTTFTNYDAALDAAGDWVLGTYSERCVADEPQLRTAIVGACADLPGPAVTKTLFERSTGFLLARRTLSGPLLASNDLLAVFSHDAAHGLPLAEKYYGGDQPAQALSTAPSAVFTPPPSPEYQLDHFYSFDSHGGLTRRQSQYHALPFFTEDVDRDVATGLPAVSRDTNGLATTRLYDFRGRLTWTRPAAAGGVGAWTTYTYSDATSAAPAQVEIAAYPNGVVSGTPLVRDQYVYDGQGRIAKERALMPSGAWTVKLTTYDGLDHVIGITEPEATETPSHRTQSSYDAFGRPLSVAGPDQKVTSYQYLGIRSVTTSAPVAMTTAGQGETAAVSTQVSDSLGRLVAVQQASSAAGLPVTTTYTYDLGDRLTSASTIGQAGPQAHLFSYDNRGFLLSAQQPELGPQGNGTTSFGTMDTLGIVASRYDSRGHALREITGPAGGTYDLSFAFDGAERLLSVSDGQGRPLKQFAYDDPTGATYAQCSGGRCNGKLAASARWNYFDDLGTVIVTDNNYYDGPAGMITRRDRTIGGPTTVVPQISFFSSQTYNDLGQLATLTYPCSAATPAWVCADPTRTVAYQYSAGMLTSVSGWAKGITYQASGLVDTVTHGDDPTALREHWTRDPNGMPRPCSILAYGPGTSLVSDAGDPCGETLTGAGTNWTTGPYRYDGAANISQIGSTSYQYDAVSRLAAVVTPGSVTRIGYDEFGNIIYNYVPPGGCRTNPDGSIACGSPSLASYPIAGTTNHYAFLTYDAAGNVTADGARSFAYDPFSKLHASTVGGRNFRYLYTSDDERIGVVERVGTNSRITWTLRDFTTQLLRTYTDDNTSGRRVFSWKEDEIWRGSSILASDSPAGAKHYVLDHLGSPRLITNAAAQVIGTQTFAAYGAGGTIGGGALQFCGQERDAANVASGTAALPDQMHQRPYDQNSGRFLVPDPVTDPAAIANPQRWNRYAYAAGNPLKYTDPTGERVSLADFADAQRTRLLEDLYLFTGNVYSVDANYELVLLQAGPNSSYTATEFLSDAIDDPNDAYYGHGLERNGQVNLGAGDLGGKNFYIDFADFERMDMRGLDPAAANTGEEMVHELTHNIKGWDDPPAPGDPATAVINGVLQDQVHIRGPIVDFVNIMHKERGLPQRGPAYAAPDGSAPDIRGRIAIPYINPTNGKTIYVQVYLQPRL